MNLWRSIRKIDWFHLMGFCWLLLKRPFLVYPIYIATQKTLSVSGKLYGKAHFKNGPANAFRHAFWNVLICKAFYRRHKDAMKATAYCEAVVNYYEKSTKNLPMDHSMDYHNNQIGRKVFLEYLDENEQKFIETLQNMATNAKKVIKVEDFANHQDSLVYLHEDIVTGILPKEQAL